VWYIQAVADPSINHAAWTPARQLRPHFRPLQAASFVMCVVDERESIAVSSRGSRSSRRRLRPDTLHPDESRCMYCLFGGRVPEALCVRCMHVKSNHMPTPRRSVDHLRRGLEVDERESIAVSSRGSRSSRRRLRPDTLHPDESITPRGPRRDNFGHIFGLCKLQAL
jgi:5-methylcytosine-specific restriction endonuclease McrA